MNDVEVDLEKISKILKKAIDLGGSMLLLLPRSQRRSLRMSLKGGDIHGSLEGNGSFLS